MRDVKIVKAVYFSPTGNTKKVVETVADCLAERFQAKRETIDFTLPKDRQKEYEFEENQLVVFGVPVYAGRVPNKILPAVQSLFHGNGALAVPIVTFGNRSYDNALIELRNELEENEFHTVTAGAFVSEHAFSDRLAAGRPNQEDINQMILLAEQTADKIQSGMNLKVPVTVKGIEPIPAYYTPLGIDGTPAVFLKAKPKTTAECTDCKQCAGACPMGSIEFEDPKAVSGICIKCQACVKTCPVNAKYFEDEAFLSHVKMLEKNYDRRAENEIFV